MVDETALFMSRYSRDLYERLEEETGLSTGFRAVGHISIATNPDRMEALRREAKFVHGFGVEDHELSTDEIAASGRCSGPTTWSAGSSWPTKAGPTRWAWPCRWPGGPGMGGATIFEGVPATGVTSGGRRVTGVVTEQGTIEAEFVVNCGGMWARQFGALAGVDVPLQAAEHYYLITEPMAGVHRDLPVVEDPDSYGYFRPEGDGLLVGLFEPVAAPWSLDGVPAGSSFVELAARLRPAGPVPRPGHGPGPGPGRHRHSQVLLRPGVLHLGRPSRCSGRHPSSTTTSWPPGSTRWGSSSGGGRGNGHGPLDRRR